MAENHRPPGTDVVNKSIAIDIRDMSPLSLLYKERLTTDGAEARTGLLTPPGMDRLARSNNSDDFVVFSSVMAFSL
jgi:hypothetical protein